MFIEGFQPRVGSKGKWLIASPTLEPIHPARFVERWTISFILSDEIACQAIRDWSADGRAGPKRYSFRFPMWSEALDIVAMVIAGVWLQFFGH